jgi:DNA-binding NarL/FixJ family response regulator
MPIRVVIADDQPLLRTGLRKVLESEPDLSVVAEAADGYEAIDAALGARADIVLMDIRMPRLDGIEATRRLALAAPATRVLILTTYDLDEYVFSALQAGASGFVLKDVPPEQLIEAVRVVAAGDALLSPSVTRRLISEFARRPVLREQPAGIAELTEREREVLQLMARGLSNREIADRLILGEATIKTHVGRVFSKLHLRDRAQAVVVAYETGIVSPGETAERP